ncbi:hypothetical protein [uncultured Cardiobacterium sp.]|uniref:hypothetical protein n=1 Tax=uncultured Cardiobacterium sp. TaxID=417619 RepID=UPI002622BF0F|nr:hypothetical protein [uncultured Cardiobacterium sp.]
MTKWMTAALAALFLALAGCAARVEYVPLTVSCPPVPPLPSISAQELQPLTDDAYRRLVERELRLKEHIGQLRALCEEEGNGK